MANINSIYTVNYMPITATQAMWNSTYYSSSEFLADLQRAVSLGFNTARIIIPCWPPAATGYLQGTFDYPTPTSTELARLTNFCGLAATAGIKLHVTLFDHWGGEVDGQMSGGYGKIAGAEGWAEAIIGALNLSQVACIELQNEMRFAYTSAYTSDFDSGYPGYPTTPSNPTIGQVSVVFAQQLIPYLRSLTGGSIPIITSCTNYEGDPGDLAVAVAQLTGSTQPDWFEWHCYPGTAAGVMANLTAAQSAVGNIAPLYIGETGTSSYASGALTSSEGLQLQADFIHTVRWCCQQIGLPEPSPWILLDNPAAQGSTSSQSYYGLIDSNYNLKPAGTLYQNHPPGHVVPGIDINGSMANAVTDINGNGLPYRWGLYMGNTGTQPITSAIDTTNYHIRGQSVLLSGFSGTSGSDNPPALMVQPSGLAWPLYNQGQAYTFSVWLKGSGNVGVSNNLPSLEISWYQSSGSYITSTNGSVINLTSGNWVQASLTSTMPSNAGYATLFVRVGYGTGQVWVDDAEWTGESVRLVTNLSSRYRRTS